MQTRSAVLKFKPALASAVALGLVWGGLWWSRDAAIEAPGQQPGMSVELLQGNIPQDEKFEMGSGVVVALRWYAQQLHDARAQLVVAPETAIPLLPQQLPEGYLDFVRAPFVAKESSRAALVGFRWATGTRALPIRSKAGCPGRPSLSVRQAPSGAVWRVHSAHVPLVHRTHEYSAGRLQSRRTGPAFHELGG
jgi:hypothetical protein